MIAMADKIFIPLTAERWKLVKQALFMAAGRAYTKGALAGSRKKMKKYKNAEKLQAQYKEEANELKRVELEIDQYLKR